MYAKKFFSFSSKPFSYISHSFSNFFGFFTVSPTDASDPEFPEQKPEFNFYQIKSQTQKDLRKSYDRWVGKMNLSHNMTEKNPCQVSLTRQSILGNILGFLSQVFYLLFSKK